MSTPITQIKRLSQNGQSFVPITLSEAVVVKTDNIPGFESGVTTLDKVLRVTLNLVDTNISNTGAINSALQDAVNTINGQLAELDAKKQDKLVAGYGITIAENSEGKLEISTNLSFELYKVVTKLPDQPAAIHSNTIFLVPSDISGESDTLEEYLCVQKDNNWAWERLGRMQASVDLSGITQRLDNLEAEVESLGLGLSAAITAEDVTTSTNQVVVVTYEIPASLYDSVVDKNNGDYIE